MAPNRSKWLKIFIVILLMVGVGTTVYLVQFTQVFKPKASSADTCQASDPNSFKDCLNTVQTDPAVIKIEVTKQIICTSTTECSNNFTKDANGNDVNLGGFVLNNRTQALTIFGTPGTNAGIKRVQNYDYPLFWIGGYASVSNLTLKDLVFDDTTAECDFIVQGDAKCNSPLVLGSFGATRIGNTTIDHLTILHSKNHSMQIAHADNMVIKNSIIYDSDRDGIWFDSAFPLKPDGTPDCVSVIVCPIVEDKTNKNIIIENNLIAESDVSAIEFYAVGTQQSPSRISDNLFVHNHKNAKYVVINGCNGHCPGGAVAVNRSRWVVIENNVIRDGVINSIKPFDQYNPGPGTRNATYDSLGLVAGGIELSSQIHNITIRNNRIFNFKGITYPNFGAGIMADYIGAANEVGDITITGNSLYNNGDNIAAEGRYSNFEQIGAQYGFTFANNIFNSAAGGPAITKAFIFADPATCTLGSNGKCSSTIRWYSNNYSDLNVTIKGVANSLFASGPSGNLEANWITAAGVGFELRDKNTNAVLAETYVNEGSSNGGGPNPSPSTTSSPPAVPDILYPSPTVSQYPGTAIQANPNPCDVSSAGTCSSKITWSYPNATDVKISIKEAPGSVFGSGPINSNTAPWITAEGATFQLVADGVVRDEVFVKGMTKNTIVATPGSCNINADNKCPVRLSWSFPDYPQLKITVKESPGSVVAIGAYGYQLVPWITTAGATFEAYNGTTLVGSVYVKGVLPTPVNSPIPSPVASASLSASPSVLSSPVATPSNGGRLGDFNGDGIINIQDFNQFILYFRSRNSRADLNSDGGINLNDFNKMVEIMHYR